MICGKIAIHAALEQFLPKPLMRLEEQSFTTTGIQEQGNDTVTVVAGSYRLYTVANEQVIFAAMRHVTACFQQDQNNVWKIFHLHISNANEHQIDDEVFPFAVNRETYDYVRRILHTGRRTGILPSRIAIEDGKLHYLDPDDILYVKAQGKYCTVQCTQSVLQLNRLLGDIENLLGGSFVRIHRSYLVNTAHVVSVERYRLTLTNGTTLPIPKQRFAQIRREIALRITE